MVRISKAPDVRRAELVAVASRLFREIGYSNCSVDRIIKEIGVAKGTFYYYFQSKPDILEAVVELTLEKIIEYAEDIANNPSLSAMQKMEALLARGHIGDEDSLELAEALHEPENRELHELTNIQTVLQLSPILASIVEQGNREGVFQVTQPLETIQFLFTGAQFLTDGGLFTFTPQEIRARRLVTQAIIEKVLGADVGSFGFMNPVRAFDGDDQSDI